jgi:signal peptidase II
MQALVIGLLLIPPVDQSIKLILRRQIGSRSISLGAAGAVRMVESQVWVVRWGKRLNPKVLWTLWGLSAAVLACLTFVNPEFGVFAGLLLGGSLSHALESALRGGICDFVCLRFWPAFNTADVAISVGAAGILIHGLCILTLI